MLEDSWFAGSSFVPLAADIEVVVAGCSTVLP